MNIIHNLVKEKGFTLDGAKKKIKDKKDDISYNLSIVNSLKDIRSFLIELKQQL